MAALYCRKLSAHMGAGTIDPRHVIGAIILKHKLGLSDAETLDTIGKNPYMQMFLCSSALAPTARGSSFTSYNPKEVDELRANGANKYIQKPNSYNQLKTLLYQSIRPLQGGSGAISSTSQFVILA